MTLGLVGICVGSLLGSLVLIHEVPLGFPRVSIARMRSLIPLTVYLGADSVLGVSAQQISILYLNVIASAYAVGVFGAHYRSSIFLIVPLVTVLSMVLYPRFCSLDVVFCAFFKIQEIRPLLLVLAAYSGLFVYYRIWDKLVTACEGAKIVGWG